MNQFFQDYFDLYKNLHVQMEEAFLDLPQQALDWVPGEGMNSISVLVMHTTGAARFLVGEVVLGVSSQRDRSAEFSAQGLTAAQLQAASQTALDVIQAALEKLTLQELEASRVSPRDGRELTVGWCLAHAFEHTAQHLGHIQITRQIWQQQYQ